MADCGSSNVGTCIGPLFIMKHSNCLDNLSHDVYSDESSDLSNAKCLTLDGKAYFSSSHKLVAAEDGVLSACENLHHSSDTAICSLDDSDTFKKKRCVDRYDSSESSDSGVLTGSTCSESSSNSGNSDITDPCSPYSVTSFHLEDNGSPLTLPSKSAFSTNDLISASKMLPEALNREEENDVSCWAWDKTIEWNDRYELTSDDIDVEVKDDTFYFDGIDDNKSSHGKIRPNCCSPPTVDGNKTSALLQGRFSSSRTGIKSLVKESVKRALLNDNNNKSVVVLPNTMLDIAHTETDYFYDKVFQPKRVQSSAADKFQLSAAFDNNSIKRSDTFRERANSLTITASNSDDHRNQRTSEYFVNNNNNNNNYPVDFFNILPSVFKGPILYSATADIDEDNSDEWESVKIADRRPIVNADHYRMTTRTTEHHSKMVCRRTETKCKPDDSDMSRIKSTNTVNHGDERLASAAPKKPDHDSCKSNHSAATAAVSNREQTRFPTADRKPSSSERICRWTDCVDHLLSSTKLIEHLQAKHVYPQTFSGTFICLWDGCKVFGRPSCSRSFLERHVLSHGGNKPFRCIVDNCGLRFSSQLMLERHVNQHFKTPKDAPDGPVDTTPKLIRRNGQKLRYRRQPYSVRNRADAFDAGIMSQLQYSLVQMVQKSKEVSLNIIDSKEFLHISFQPKVIGSRQEADGETKYLIRWYPYNSLEDEWLSKSEIENKRTIPIQELPTSVQQMFWNSIFPRQSPKLRHSRKYKPESRNT